MSNSRTMHGIGLPRWFRGAVISVVLGALCLVAVADDTIDAALVARLASLSANSQEVLHYRETRDGGLFSGPVDYTGRLEWIADSGELVQWIDTPTEARLSVGDDRVEIRSGSGRTRTFPLSGRPGLGAMMTGLKALLSGDPVALDEVFLADYLEAEDESWLLHLKPRDPELQGHLALLEVRGNGDQLTAIDRVDAEGVRQAMTIVAEPGSS